MNEKRRRAWVTVVKSVVSLIAGLVVLVLLFPAGGVDPIPPQCWSAFEYSVPCGTGLSFAAGAATAGVVGLALWLDGRRRRHRRRDVQ